MPTRLRVDLTGYDHIINRGVNRCNIFNNDENKEIFLQIFNKTATIHKVVLHDYYLVDNHYHLLIETTKENFSTLVRNLNAYEDGYTQVSIAEYLDVSTSLVSKVIKSGYSITVVSG